MNSKTSLIFVCFLIFLVISTSAAAIDINYTIKVNLLDSSNNTVTNLYPFTQNCSLYCNYSLPVFEIAPGYTFINYGLDYEPSPYYAAYFYSTGSDLTQSSEDLVMVNVLSPEDGAGNDILSNQSDIELEGVICGAVQCDKECTICSDKKCHEPSFECIESLNIDNIFPQSVGIGVSQINLLIRNSGNVDFNDLYATISGDGVYTAEMIPIKQLVAGDKDYTFIKINSTTAGNKTTIIQLNVGNRVYKATIWNLEIQGAEEKVNVTELLSELDKLKEQQIVLEEAYQNKSAEGYTVDIIYDQLKDSREYLSNAQSYLVEENYAKAAASLKVAKENLDDIDRQLKNVRKKKETLKDKIRSNVIYIGSTAAAIVSMFAAYGLIRNAVAKQKLVHKERLLRLRERMKRSKKGAKSKSKGKSKRKK